MDTKPLESLYYLVGFLVLSNIGVLVKIFLKSTSKTEQKIEELTIALHNVTVALGKLETKIEFFSNQVFKIPKLEKDLDSAHSAIRRLNNDN